MRPRGIQDVISSKGYSSTQRGSRGTVRVRGLRDALSAQKMTDRSIPATHAQRLSEISWLEREAERLQREANIVEANLQRIRNRLSEIAEYREYLLAIVRESLGIVPASDPGASRASASGANRLSETDSGFEIVAIEY